MLNKHADDCY